MKSNNDDNDERKGRAKANKEERKANMNEVAGNHQNNNNSPSILEEMKHGHYPAGFVTLTTTGRMRRSIRKSDPQQQQKQEEPRPSGSNNPSLLAEMKAGRYPVGFIPSTTSTTARRSTHGHHVQDNVARLHENSRHTPATTTTSTPERQQQGFSYIKQFLSGVTVHDGVVDVSSAQRLQQQQEEEAGNSRLCSHTAAAATTTTTTTNTIRQGSYVKQFLTGVTVHDGVVDALSAQRLQQQQAEDNHTGPATTSTERQGSYVKQFLTGVTVHDGLVNAPSAQRPQHQQEQEETVERGRENRRLLFSRSSYSQSRLTQRTQQQQQQQQQEPSLWARRSTGSVSHQSQDCNRTNYSFSNKFPWLANFYSNFETNETGRSTNTTTTQTNNNQEDSACVQETVRTPRARPAGNAAALASIGGGQRQLPIDNRDQTTSMMLAEEALSIEESDHRMNFIFPGAYRVGGEYDEEGQSLSLESFTGTFATDNTPQLSAVVVDDEFVAKRQQAILQAYKRKRTMSRDLDDGNASHAWLDVLHSLDGGEGARREISTKLGQQITSNGHGGKHISYDIPCAMPIVNSHVIGGVTHPTPPPLRQDTNNGEITSRNNGEVTLRKCCVECCIVILFVAIAVLIVATGSGMVFGSSSSSSSSSSVPRGFYGACFQDREELWRAVDKYMVDSSPGTMVALRYGWPIGNWCVDQLTDLAETFSAYRNDQAKSFNEPLTRWNIPMATNASYMFAGAEAFDQPIGHWNVSSVEVMHEMFSNAKSFKGFSPTGDGLALWDVRTVHNFESMFHGARKFDGNLCAWVDHMQIDADVHNMFAESACPVTADPVLDGYENEATNPITALCRPC